MSQQNKLKKVGRPKLPKGKAKGKIVPIRFTEEIYQAIEAKATSENQTVSEWIRIKIHAEI